MKLVHRAGAALAAGALVLTTAGSAQAAAVDTSADWLTRQLTNGIVHNEQWEFNDYGLTADTVYALKEIGGKGTTLREIRTALAKHVNSWTTGADFGSPDQVFDGSVAKAVVVAQTTGADPRSFGGVNLVRRLQQQVGSNGAIESNTVGQAWAARGLSAANSAKAPAATSFLLEQQCAEGYFRLDFGTDCSPDTDTTALAVINLKAIPRPSAAVRTAISKATSWLKANQRTNGSFGGGTATTGSNTNSTGLASWALGKVGACGPAVKAARWVQKLQVRGDVSGTPLARERGAIAYDRASYTAGQADGIAVESQDQWRRATTQAAPSLGNLTLSACRAG